MSDLQLIWLSTVLTVLATAILFVVLAQWSTGGSAPWSIAAGMARGISDWASAGPDRPRAVSPRALELPPLEMDELAVASLRHPPLSEPQPQAEVEELWERRLDR